MWIEETEAIVGRWFREFWGKDFNPAVIDDSPPPMSYEYSLHAPCCGREEVRAFAAKFRAAFSDLNFRAPPRPGRGLGQWEGGGPTGDAFDMPVGSLPPATGKKRFTGTTIPKVDRLVAEEIGLDDGVTVLQQLGLITTA